MPVAVLKQRVPSRRRARDVNRAASAAGRRAAISFIPKIEKHAAIHQCMSTGLSTASSPLNRGTVQFPVSTMV